MTWTRKRPTQAGWYWYKDKESVRVVHLIPALSQYDSRKLIRQWDNGNVGYISSGYWSGPLEQPK